jgi:hypothetical protein
MRSYKVLIDKDFCKVAGVFVKLGMTPRMIPVK